MNHYPFLGLEGDISLTQASPFRAGRRSEQTTSLPFRAGGGIETASF